MEPLLLPWIVASRKRKIKDEEEKAVIPRKQFNVVPQFRLIFYDAKGPVEMSRMVLAYSGIPFDDVRLKTEKELTQAIKASPNKALPILEWNSKKLCDSDAIARMLARMYGLGGQGIFEQAQADAIHGIFKEFVYVALDYIKLKASRFQTNQLFKAKPVTSEVLKAQYMEIFLPAVKKHFGIMENYASQSSSGFFLDSGVSYVDFGMASFFEFLYHLHPEELSMFPKIRAIVTRVSKIPRLQNYLEKRPKTVW